MAGSTPAKPLMSDTYTYCCVCSKLNQASFYYIFYFRLDWSQIRETRLGDLEELECSVWNADEARWERIWVPAQPLMEITFEWIYDDRSSDYDAFTSDSMKYFINFSSAALHDFVKSSLAELIFKQYFKLVYALEAAPTYHYYIEECGQDLEESNLSWMNEVVDDLAKEASS